MDNEVDNENENQDYEMCEFEEKLEYIKTNLTGQIFNAGVDFSFKRVDYMDKKGNISEKDEEVLEAEVTAILKTYRDVADLVWNEVPEYLCDECQQRRDDEDTVEKLDQELKKNNWQN